MDGEHLDLQRALERARQMVDALPARLPRLRDPLLGLWMARTLDMVFRNVAAGWAAIDLAIGEGLAALNVGWRKMDLGYSNIGDYAREELGMNPSTAAKKERLARRLARLPVLREAVRSGEVTFRKAEIVAPHVTKETQGVWVQRAKVGTVRALQSKLQAGADPDDEQYVRFVTEVPREQMPVVQDGMRMGGIVLGSRSTAAERITGWWQEYLASHTVPEREDGLDDARLHLQPVDDVEAAKEVLEEQNRKWADLVKVQALRAREFSGEIDPWRIDAELKGLVAMREGWDELFGRVGKLFKSGRAWDPLGFNNFEHYCEEMLGMSERTASQRIALEYDLERFPALRQALREGRISYEKARVIARHAEGNELAHLIEKAQKTTCIDLRDALHEKAEAQMCARGLFTAFVPLSIRELAKDILRAVRAQLKRIASAGECLVMTAAHFIVTWVAHIRERMTLKKRVAARDRHRCQVPGCSRPAVDCHHIRYRVHGGPDEEWNLISVCLAHHHGGIHDGRLRVTGRAPDELTWEFGLRRSFAATAVP